jgi:hypothetical protein
LISSGTFFRRYSGSLCEDGNNYKWKNAFEEGKTMQVETEGVQNSRPNLNEGKVNYEDFFESRKRILK